MFDRNISQVLPCSMLHNKVCMLLNHVWLFSTPWIVACQALLSMRFFRQEYWSGLPFPSPGNLPNPGMEPGSHALQADSLLSKPPGGSMLHNIDHLFLLKPPTMFLPSISWVNIIKKNILTKILDVYWISWQNHWRFSNPNLSWCSLKQNQGVVEGVANIGLVRHIKSKSRVDLEFLGPEVIKIGGIIF